MAYGVEVTLINGDVAVGDIVIGCDSIYSTVKGFMWDHANKTIPDFITVKEKTCKFLFLSRNTSKTRQGFPANYVSFQNSMEILDWNNP